jgi:hypothetical protein
MSIGVRFTALYAAWLVASLTEAHELGEAHAGVNVDAPKAPHQWHGELPQPQPVLRPAEVMPFNNSAQFDQPPMRRHWQQPANELQGTPLVLRLASERRYPVPTGVYRWVSRRLREQGAHTV